MKTKTAALSLIIVIVTSIGESKEQRHLPKDFEGAVKVLRGEAKLLEMRHEEIRNVWMETLKPIQLDKSAVRDKEQTIRQEHHRLVQEAQAKTEKEIARINADPKLDEGEKRKPYQAAFMSLLEDEVRLLKQRQKDFRHMWTDILLPTTNEQKVLNEKEEAIGLKYDRLLNQLRENPLTPIPPKEEEEGENVVPFDSLAAMEGQWKVEAVSVRRHPIEHVTGTCSIQSVLNRKFLRLDLLIKSSDDVAIELMELIGFSEKRQRKWTFDIGGSSIEASFASFEEFRPGVLELEWLRTDDDNRHVRDFISLNDDEMYLYYTCEGTDTHKATKHRANYTVKLVRASDE